MVIGTTEWIYIIILVITLIGLLMFILNELKYKHKVIIREIANDRRIIRIDRACEFKDGSGIQFWKLKKERDKLKKFIPTPPDKSIEITNKGKKFIEVYRTEQGEYVFIQDKNDKIASLQPLTTNDRLTLIHSYKTAEFKNKKSLGDQLQQWVITGGLIILIVMGLIFAPDIITSYTKGATQISDSLSKYEDMRHDNFMLEIKEWEKVNQGIQTIYNIEKNNSNRITNLENK